MKIKTVIVDDNQGAIESFKQICENFFPQINLVAEYNNAKEAFDFIKKNQIDWLVLDIDLQSEVNGFDLLNLIGVDRNFEVIFYSGASDQYLEAIRAHAFEFLSKPFSISELKNSINRYLFLRKNTVKLQKNIINENSNIKETKVNERFLKINNHNQTIFINQNDIVFLIASGAYTIIHYQEKQDIKTSKNLAQFSKLLNKNNFIRISRSVIINKNQIESIFKDKDVKSTIIFKDGKTLVISNMIRKKLNETLNNIS